MGYVTPEDVRKFTGVGPASLNLNKEQDPDTALNNLLSTWIDQISAEVDIRLGESVSSGDSRYKGIQAVVLRTMGKLIAYAVENRNTRVVQIGEFAVRMLNSSEITASLDEDLRPYRQAGIGRRKITIFHSGADYIDPNTEEPYEGDLG